MYLLYAKSEVLRQVIVMLYDLGVGFQCSSNVISVDAESFGIDSALARVRSAYPALEIKYQP